MTETLTSKSDTILIIVCSLDPSPLALDDFPAKEKDGIYIEGIQGSSKDSEEDLRRRKLLAEAPVLAFDNDLRYWEEKKLHITPITKFDSLHRFWNASEFDEEFIPDGLEESLRSRSMPFSGEFESVKWNCRALLPNGKLCIRQDRLVVKCL